VSEDPKDEVERGVKMPNMISYIDMNEFGYKRSRTKFQTF
jgi:hypothetical protein